ncbi:hypothetical protein Fot_53334 [Forsythia ovata]|uniref:Uncharacterized protein n=1 Tax=Forsythia ovata TaxID=205694 RepID=A0ABD1PID8_9LAMI
MKATTILSIRGKSRMRSPPTCVRGFLTRRVVKRGMCMSGRDLKESQHANPQDKPTQYFSENLSHTEIELALPDDFSPRHLRPYQLAYVPGGKQLPFFTCNRNSLDLILTYPTFL